MLLVEAVRIQKSFAGVRALRDVSFSLRPGEVHALIGENGAGKSTLMNVMAGAIQPDSGQLAIGGETIVHHSPARAKSLGIAAIRQQPALFPTLTVAENIGLACEEWSWWRRVPWRQRRQHAQQLLAQVGANFGPDTLAGALSMAQQQLLEIAKAIGTQSSILIMDEPTAALTNREVEHLFRLIHELRAGGRGIIYISHRLEELAGIADRVSVLRDGQSVETRPMSEVDTPTLVRLMVGRDLAEVYPKEPVPAGNLLLEVEGVHSAALGLHGIDLKVHAGEIVGLAGLVGAGRTELANVLFGLVPADCGEIRLRGQPARITSAAEAIAHGLAYVPEDRRRHGVIGPMSITENITLASLGAVSRAGLLQSRSEQQIAGEYAARLAVKTPTLAAPVETLSGGNQQKVALGRWLATHPSVLILDEPTQGIDVGAKADVHRLMVSLARQGVGILMISSELPEVLGMSDRIYVMAGGTITGELSRAAATPQGILQLALPVAA